MAQEQSTFQNAIKKYGTVAIIISLLSGGGLYLINADNLYWCSSRNMVQEFDRLSSTKITGYFTNGTYMRCSEGWVKVSDLQSIIIPNNTETIGPLPDIVEKVTDINGKVFNCLGDSRNLYTICMDDDGRKSYAAEVVRS